jgi:hypothetical protein
MSYTEYMNRKKAAAPVILNVQPKMDASTYTRHKRVSAAAFYSPTKSVVGNIFDMRMSSTRDSNAVKPSVQVTLATGSGGDVPDASTYSDYVAGRAANMDYKNGPIIGRVLLNSNDATSIKKCAPATPEPTPAKVAKTGSQATRDTLACYEIQGEPHIATGPSPVNKGISHFIDDTISLNSGTYRIGTGSKGSTGSTIQSSNNIAAGCPPAIHEHPALTPHAGWAPRPSKGAGGLFNPVVASQDHPYKAGAAIDKHKYVERHHGNDWGVNPRRVPTPYRIPANAPAHLKINDPHPTI